MTKNVKPKLEKANLIKLNIFKVTKIHKEKLQINWVKGRAMQFQDFNFI